MTLAQRVQPNLIHLLRKCPLYRAFRSFSEKSMRRLNFYLVEGEAYNVSIFDPAAEIISA